MSGTNHYSVRRAVEQWRMAVRYNEYAELELPDGRTVVNLPS